MRNIKCKTLKRVKKLKVYIILLLLMFCLLIHTGCFPHSSILFIYKNYTYELLESQPETREKLKKNCRVNGYTPHFIVITREGEKSIRNIINETEASVIYIDPLIRESPVKIAGQYTDKLFFTHNRDIGSRKPPNLLTLHFNRRDAYNEAGIIAGKFLLHGIPEQKAGEMKTIRKAGMIVYPASSEVQGESAEYISGFSTICSDDLFIYREVNNITDKVKIKNILDDMKNNGVVIFFFKVYSLNIYCLDYVKREGGYSIVENSSFHSGYEDILLFSIEDDFPMSLFEVFNNIRTGNKDAKEWEKKEIKGKVIIKWGNTFEPLE